MAKKQLKFNVDRKGSNDGVTVLKFEAGKSYVIGEGADQVGPELVKAFTEDQKVKVGDKEIPVAEVVEEKETPTKAKTTAGEEPPPKPKG